MRPRLQNRLPEVWGGLECTVNRLASGYRDQIQLSGHEGRGDDLALFHSLGIKKLRYPLLWERVSPRSLTEFDWRWSDERFARLKELAIEPIVGLLHHGSGPVYTDLLDAEFPEKLAHYAKAVAERYPHLTYFTPINEPLTTARFSCLYGHWYPHAKEDTKFAQAFFNQCRAIRSAMKAIRQIKPDAQLVQTDDLGTVLASPSVRYQADFENERRWLTWDVLNGNLGPDHLMWDYFRWLGISETTLQSFREDPLPPDIIGINHYVASDRFLDDDLSKYPESLHGGNGRHRYVDVEAVRICENKALLDPYRLFWSAWERYKIPLAITEVHIGCTREEQLRWLRDLWEAACKVNEDGGELVGFTSWGLLGLHDWDSLLTRFDGNYETGAFCTRGSTPRPTAIARAVKDLAQGFSPRNVFIDGNGWWKQFDRASLAASPHPILILGAAGTLGTAFTKIAATRGLPTVALTRAQFDFADPEAVDRLLKTYQPIAMIHCAGYVQVDGAEQAWDRCFRENTEAPILLATGCARLKIPFVTFSSDLVFDGRKESPYVESDFVNPLNRYGTSKAEAEQKVLAIHGDSLVVRTSAFFGPWDAYNFITHSLRALAERKVVRAVSDVFVSPTYVPELVNATLDLLVDGEIGIWHLANQGAVTWYEFLKTAAEMAKLPTDGIVPVALADVDLAAKRPRYSALTSERGNLLRPWDRALFDYFTDLKLSIGNEKETS